MHFPQADFWNFEPRTGMSQCIGYRPPMQERKRMEKRMRPGRACIFEIFVEIKNVNRESEI